MEKDHGSTGENEKKYTGVKKVNRATAASGDGKGHTHTHTWHGGDARGNTVAALGGMRGARIGCKGGGQGRDPKEAVVRAPKDDGRDRVSKRRDSNGKRLRNPCLRRAEANGTINGLGSQGGPMDEV